MNKNTLQMTGGISQGGAPGSQVGQQPPSGQGNGKFRELDRYGGDETQSNGQARPARAKQAWDTGSRMSK